MNKVDGLIIFDLEDAEMEEILQIKNSIHRKRLRNGKLNDQFEYPSLGITILQQFKNQIEKAKKKTGSETSKC